MLLHHGDEDVCDIFDTLIVPEADTNDNVNKSEIKVVSHFRKEVQRTGDIRIVH